MRRCLASALACLSLFGCGSTLSVTRINSAEAKPNNVWVFFTVEDDEEPVAGLTAEDFAIYEDESLVSPFESQQVIQNPEVAAVMYTHLLLDMSGSRVHRRHGPGPPRHPDFPLDKNLEPATDDEG